MTSEAKKFTTVFRGFDPAEVESALTALRAATAAAQADTAASHARLAAAEAERDELRSRFADIQARLDAREALDAEASQSVFVHLGKRIGNMLSLAEAEATALRNAASQDADAIRHDAQVDAESVRQRAELAAAEVRERAETEAEHVEFEAKQRASTMLDEAIRDATARREEAEAYFERQRATAAAAAAEFERTLGERRDQATEDFQAQMAAQDEALRRAQDRVATLIAEADQERQQAAEETAARLQAARQEADELLESARAHAERIRRDSERELAAAMARRDSITSQLTNVRQMLATFGVSTGDAASAELEQAAVALAQDPNDGTAVDGPAVEVGAVEDSAELDAADVQQPADGGDDVADDTVAQVEDVSSEEYNDASDDTDTAAAEQVATHR